MCIAFLLFKLQIMDRQLFELMIEHKIFINLVIDQCFIKTKITKNFNKLAKLKYKS